MTDTDRPDRNYTLASLAILGILVLGGLLFSTPGHVRFEDGEEFRMEQCSSVLVPDENDWDRTDECGQSRDQRLAWSLLVAVPVAIITSVFIVGPRLKPKRNSLGRCTE